MTHSWQTWIAAIALLTFAFFIWRRTKGAFNKSDFAKSFKAMGVLALGLIVFVTVLVIVARG